jgi:hypothetical protein
MSAVPTPFSGIPMTRGTDMPSPYRVAPANRPWSDSTRPIAASSVHGKPQGGSVRRARTAARWYARRATAGIPSAAKPDGTPKAALGGTRPGEPDAVATPDIGVGNGPADGVHAVAGGPAADGVRGPESTRVRVGSPADRPAATGDANTDAVIAAAARVRALGRRIAGTVHTAAWAGPDRRVRREPLRWSISIPRAVQEADPGSSREQRAITGRPLSRILS